MANIYEPDFDEPRDHDGFRAKRARLGIQIGTERLGISVWELPPGQAAYPYHFHLGEEEAILVLEGSPTLRQPDGERTLDRGEAISFLAGESGAHQLLNHTDETIRFIAISTNGAPDIVGYPDSHKVGAAERRPDGGGFKMFFPLDAEVDYWEGESPPG